MRSNSLPTVLTVLGAVFLTAPVLAQAPVVDSAALNQRLLRMERTLNSSSLVQLAQSVQNLQREIQELRGEVEIQTRDISRLRARQRDLYLDLDKRLLAMETRAGSTPPPVQGAEATTPGATAAATPTVPPASASTPSTAQNSGTTQPAIIASATPAASAQTQSATGTTSAATPTQTTQPPAATIDPAAEQQAYRAAFDLLKKGKFDSAANALQGFLKDYPNGRFADNAQYWLGEAYYVNRKFDPALKAFERLLIDFPDSPKRSHAMLKIGFIHDEAGRQQPAKQILTQLIQRYPQSTAAGLAKKRLSRLR
jgi:tol-pal system protein YbgF